MKDEGLDRPFQQDPCLILITTGVSSPVQAVLILQNGFLHDELEAVLDVARLVQLGA